MFTKKSTFDSKDIAKMDKRYRTAFVNSLSGFKSANLIGTVNQSGQTNLAIMSSAVHIGANPPLIGLIIRPDQGDRHTLNNILDGEFYTINHINEEMISQAHQTSARYPREVSEFNATGLGEHWLEDFSAPFVEQSVISMGMKLCEHHKIEVNGTHLIVGEIQLVLMPEECLLEDGFVDIEKAGTLAISGLDAYHKPRHPKRMTYAKPNRSPTELDS